MERRSSSGTRGILRLMASSNMDYSDTDTLLPLTESPTTTPTSTDFVCETSFLPAQKTTELQHSTLHPANIKQENSMLANGRADGRYQSHGINYPIAIVTPPSDHLEDSNNNAANDGNQATASTPEVLVNDSQLDDNHHCIYNDDSDSTQVKPPPTKPVSNVTLFLNKMAERTDVARKGSHGSAAAALRSKRHPALRKFSLQISKPLYNSQDELRDGTMPTRLHDLEAKRRHR